MKSILLYSIIIFQLSSFSPSSANKYKKDLPEGNNIAITFNIKEVKLISDSITVNYYSQILENGWVKNRPDTVVKGKAEKGKLIIHLTNVKPVG